MRTHRSGGSCEPASYSDASRAGCRARGSGVARSRARAGLGHDHRLAAEGLSLAYGDRTVVGDLDLQIRTGAITTIVGANGCGKSTLLRAFARLLPPQTGRVVLDGREIHRTPTKQIAREIGLLPQNTSRPKASLLPTWWAGGGIHTRACWPGGARATIRSSRSRSRPQISQTLPTARSTRLSRWAASARVDCDGARAETGILLLDEPTTFLDVAHQIEVLDLLTDLNRSRGTTIVMVLHDLNLAARYADETVAMKDGQIHAVGAPDAVVTEDLVRDVFGMDSRVIPDPVSGSPVVLPMGRHHVRR